MLQAPWLSRPAANRRNRRPVPKQNGGACAPPFAIWRFVKGSAEQPEHGLAGLGGERQGGGRELLPGLQREQVGTFLVGVGERQAVGAGLPRVDQRLGEVLDRKS